MNKYDIIIIGSGISGLYIAYNLLKLHKNLKLLVLEKNNYLGGRIFTFSKNINNHTFTFEAGAGRLNNNHKLFLNLINELNLTNDLIKINSEIYFYPMHGYEKYNGKSPFEFINKVIIYSKKDTKENIQKYTFIEYAKQILNKEDIKFILDSFGFYKQLVKMNAYNALKLCDKGMNPNLQFYTLQNGFSSVIKELYKRILNLGGKILLNTDVINITPELNIITNKKIYNAKTCICSIQKPDLLKLNIFNKFKPLLNSISNKSLCRIYSIFKNKDIWFENINKTTTNNNIRMVVPLDKKNGSIMISYSDSKFADGWNKLYNKNNDEFINTIKKNIFRTFHKKIETPIYTKICYWKYGTAYWKQNKDSSTLSDKIIKPINDINLYICGENYSETQGWIEGALETSEKVLHHSIFTPVKI
jgi:hypothetical protein